jgi:pSer/pThr/pTyr-binding forkhead associated (FHA) protein/tetratricopeptide (TPR) repeat protein
MLKLLIEDEEGRKTVVPMVRSEISIGRQDGNTIRLTERNVSRRHARIVRDDDGRHYIEDSSRYGSRKNGKRFGGRTTFEEGDVVVIGEYKLALRSGDAAIDAPIVQGPASAGPPPIPGAARGDTPADPETIAMPRAKAADTPANRVGRLVCTSGPFVGGEFKVLGNEVIIGRAPDSDVVIEHPSVSKQHARILREVEDVFIEDLGSSNGITVNGQLRKRAALRSGDQIEIGGLEFRFVTGDGPVVLPLPASTSDDYAAAPGRSMAPLAIGGVVLVAIVGVGVYFAFRPPPAPVETVTSQVDHASRAALDEGQSHLNAARWDDAIAALGRVAADSEHAELATSLSNRASSEKANQAIYDEVVRLHEEGNHEASFRRLNDIPRGSYYRTRVTDENLERRVLGALIDVRIVASNEAQRAGDLALARTTLDDVRTIAPDDARIQARLAELDAAAAGQPAPQQDTAVAVVPPTRDEPRVATPTPERPTTDAGARTPTPERTTDAGSRTTAPVVAEPVAAANTDDTRARANDLKAAARRAGIQGNHQEAIRLLEEAAELNRGDSQINLMLFQNYRSIGNRNRAARALRRYLEQEPGDPRRAEYETWLTENAPE